MKALLTQWRGRLKDPAHPDEYEVKDLLRRLGLQVPQGIRLEPGAVNAVPAFPGPYAAKVCSPDILHKSDCHGVRLNIASADLKGTLCALHDTFPEADLLVEKMVAFEGPEMILGALLDPAFGPAVMVGAGGILTEILQDVSFRLAPLDEAEAKRMLAELKIQPVFEGFRGLRVDARSLAQLLVTISRLVDTLGPHFDQLDLNPVVWDADGWRILDAKLILRTVS
jgi:acetyltransferase